MLDVRQSFEYASAGHLNLVSENLPTFKIKSCRALVLAEKREVYWKFPIDLSVLCQRGQGFIFLLFPVFE